MSRNQTRQPNWLEFALVSFGFVALSFVFCYPVGLSTKLFNSDGDCVTSYYPYLLRCFTPVSSSLSGHWDATLFTGLPESHSPFGRYYPPTIFLNALLPVSLAMSLGIVLHHAWAGLGAYLLARLFGLRRAGSWLAGIIFAF